MRSVSARSSAQVSVRVVALFAFPHDRGASRASDRRRDGRRTSTRCCSRPPVNHVAHGDAVATCRAPACTASNRMPRKRTTASQNHSGSSIERATRSAKSSMPSRGHEARRRCCRAAARRRGATRPEVRSPARESTRDAASRMIVRRVADDPCDVRARRPARVARPRDDRPRRRAPRDRRDRGARHRRRARAARRRHRPRRPPADADALAEMDDFVRDDAHEVGAAPRDRGVDGRRSPTPARRCSRTCSAHVPDAGDRAAVRQLDRRRPPVPRPRTSPSSTSTCTTAASTCRRSRSCAGAGTPRSTRSGPGKAETHRALADIRESIAELRYYREHMLVPPPAPHPAEPASDSRHGLTQFASVRAARGARRGAW